jgi:adenylate cyclase
VRGRRSPLDGDTVTSRALLERRTIHVHDLAGDAGYGRGREVARSLGYRTVVATPLLREGAPVGALIAVRTEVRPFSAAQVKLLETFADQAVIAIENARLFGELQERNRELTEALERQTATAEVLELIAGSPGDLQPTFDGIVRRARGLLDGLLGVLYGFDGELVTIEADDHVTPENGQLLRSRFPLAVNRSEAANFRRVLVEQQVFHAEDAAADPNIRPSPFQRASGYRSLLIVPMLREGAAIGAIGVARGEVRPFTATETELLQSFANQAVIAIENTRLFSELADLNRTLEARVAEQVGELERVGRLRRYLSPRLADLIVSSGDEAILASHRRQITVVFCDLRGFTAFAEVAEPEEVMGVLAEYHAALGQLIHEHGGTIEQFAGDGVMVFFNDPLPQPDHAERAVRMAVAMRDCVADLARRWRRQGHRLDFGVGIAMGYATLGRIGFEGRYDYAAIGSVSNLAARLCGEAAGGQILISGRVLGVVEELVETEELGDLVLKGFHRPVDAYNVMSLRDDGSAPADPGTA